MCIAAGCALISMQNVPESFTDGRAVPATGQRISLIKCRLPHVCVMNEDASLLSGTKLLPRFLSAWWQKSVKQKWIALLVLSMPS